MSINVEMIGTGLVIQHYAYETAGKDHCHMVSISDVLTPTGWTTVQVIWDLKADPSTTRPASTPTQSALTRPRSSWTSSPGTARPSRPRPGARQAASGDHCRRETPLFAASIGRHANATS
jgi:hypothetical protein